MHHSQAVEMTALLRTRSHNTELLALGKRISISQTDEMQIHEAVAGGSRQARLHADEHDMSMT